jgi:hypothetical protein
LFRLMNVPFSVDEPVMRYTRGSPIRPAVQYGGIYETAGASFVSSEGGGEASRRAAKTPVQLSRRAC